jgi:adenosyl cobinamide kinase/adenosyl cobinamide phosphate guanylyltransferase
VNQRVAAACDTVVLMVAGIPLTVKARPVRT